VKNKTKKVKIRRIKKKGCELEKKRKEKKSRIRKFICGKKSECSKRELLFLLSHVVVR